MPRPTEHADALDEGPSRTALRREALDVLAFARQLSELPPARLAKLELPDAVRDELAFVQGTPSHIAHKRALAHLAKVMRGHAEEDFASARAALANDKASGVRDAAELHRVEALRERLLGDNGDAVLTELITTHPELDRQQMRALIRQARLERDKARQPRAFRELFRILRDLEKKP
ncbi:MAG TPA: ribosome biogenesis factor YjgA [Rhodanobacteraceae bacterium]|jgi:ribosome-associated protein|nr:ribosome biogenesis factor YjgA [Rhodanobacteraceae bacterium]